MVINDWSLVLETPDNRCSPDVQGVPYTNGSKLWSCDQRDRRAKEFQGAARTPPERILQGCCILSCQSVGLWHSCMDQRRPSKWRNAADGEK